ncbi:MAG: ABC transporter ATP-binding protein [Betaproteobacteria bacterium]|nr:ABC transporter ATP-binding protein [Betaproteobacteria bacterium]
MSESLLQVSNLRITIGKARVVDGISFAIAPRQTFVLLGESGSGKSMTALSIMRLLPESAHYQAGDIRLHGQDLLGLPESAMRPVRGGMVGMIFQEPMTSLNPVLTLGEQIKESLSLHQRLHGRALHEAAADLLQSVGIADAAQRLHDYPFQISGGMKQRVMIAISLAGNPALLIADEPTTALDVTVQAQVLELLRKVQRERGMGMLLITHDLAVAAYMADQVGVMYAGELVEMAPREVFFKQAQHPYSQKLFAALPSQPDQVLQAIAGSVPALDKVFEGCRFADRCDETQAICRNAIPAWQDLGNGHQVRCHGVSSPFQIKPGPALVSSRSAQPILRVHDRQALLKVRDAQVYFDLRPSTFFGKRRQLKAVDGVSLDLFPGETLALVGESGCGKTTLGKSLVQLQPLTAGYIELDGVALGGHSRRLLQVQRAAIQMVFQDPFASLNPRMRIHALLEEGMVALGVEPDATRRQILLEQLMTQVGMSKQALNRYPHEFSGGQRQRIAIARALAVQPRLLVCDEPTSALDVSVQAQIVNLLRELQTSMGLSLLFITHNLPLARHLAQRMAVMYLGRIVEQGDSAAIADTPAHPYSQALLQAVPTLTTHTLVSLRGEPASASHPPIGCHFHPRCPRAEAICQVTYPALRTLQDGRQVACYFPIDPVAT